MLAVCREARRGASARVGPGRLKVAERRLGLDQAQLHQPARRVVDEHEQGALRPAALEPPVPGAVDLHQPAQAVPARARLEHALPPVLAPQPKPVGNHPLPQRLDAQRRAVQFQQLLSRQRRAKIGMPLPDQADHYLAQRRTVGAIAGPAALARHQALGALALKRTLETKELTPSNPSNVAAASMPRRPSPSSTKTLRRSNSC